MLDGGWSFGNSRSAMEPASPPAYQMFDGDEGWMIDDIKITDLRTAGAVITPDTTAAGTATCGVQGNTGNCGIITVAVAGASGGSINGGALLQATTLDARTSSAADDPATVGVVEGACDVGVLQYQWTCMSGDCATPMEVVQSFSPDGTVIVSPNRDTTFKLDVRCSSDPACAATTNVVVKKYTGEGNDLNPQTTRGDGLGLQVFHSGDDCNRATAPPGGTFASTSAQLCWPSGPQIPGASGYDVHSADSRGPTTGTPVFPGNVFAGARCVAGNVANGGLNGTSQTTDASIPTLGRSHFYQIGHNTAMAGGAAALGIQPPSASQAGQLVMSGMGVCP
jgi:hypothetical protein